MGRPLLVGGSATLAGDLALACGIHGREAASALSGHLPPGGSGCVVMAGPVSGREESRRGNERA
jgi:hypothetical protein